MSRTIAAAPAPAGGIAEWLVLAVRDDGSCTVESTHPSYAEAEAVLYGVPRTPTSPPVRH